MNNISQISVFDYMKIEILGDLERIKLFFENLDDKELCESIENERKNINEKLIKYMYENSENFGKDCVIDGKFLDTYANHYSKEKCEDNRAEHDATNSCKTYYMKDGTTKKE